MVENARTQSDAGMPDCSRKARSENATKHAEGPERQIDGENEAGSRSRTQQKMACGCLEVTANSEQASKSAKSARRPTAQLPTQILFLLPDSASNRKEKDVVRELTSVRVAAWTSLCFRNHSEQLPLSRFHATPEASTKVTPNSE